MNKIGLIICTMLLLLTGPLAGIVAGESTYRELTYDFQSKLGYDLGATNMDSINSGNYSAGDEFKNVLDNNGKRNDGIYWGNMLPPYRVNTYRTGAWLKIPFSYTFTKQDLQFGSSDYWIRVPVDGDYVEYVGVMRDDNDVSEWDYDVQFYNNTNDFYYWSYNRDIIGTYFWNDTDRAIFTSTGVYLNMLYPLLPGKIEFTFIIKPLDFNSIPFYLSNENYSDANYVTSYNFDSKLTPAGRQNSVSEKVLDNLPSTPAISFLFLTGYDNGGYSSIILNPDENLFIMLPFDNDQDGHYPSVYLPFRCEDLVTFEMDWTLKSGEHNLTGGAGVDVNTTTATFENQRDFFLATCPYSINTTLGTDYIYINISADKPIILLVRPMKDPDDYATWRTKITKILSWGRYENNILGYGVFCIHDFTGSEWARTYKYPGFSYIDYGHSSGYKYPGETEVYIFLDTGAEIFYDGPTEDLWDFLTEEEYTLKKAVNDAVIGSVSFIADKYLKNLVKTLNTGMDFLYNFLGNLIVMLRKAWKFFEQVIEYFDSMMSILPYFLLVVLVEFVGSRLYVNHSNGKGERGGQPV